MKTGTLIRENIVFLICDLIQKIRVNVNKFIRFNSICSFFILCALFTGLMFSTDALADGTLYYSRSEVVEGKFDINIYRSRFLNGEYVESEKLEETVNSPTIDVYPFIAPDGSYLIYNTSRYGIGFQLCISFLKKDGFWTEAKPVKKLLGSFISWCQGISPDSQYLFFAGHKNGVWDIYWVDAKIIEELKANKLK